MQKKYINEYVKKEDHVLLYIYGLKYEAIITLELEDYDKVSKVHWGLMAVGKEGSKKIIPFTTINRTSISLGRWLLNVHDSNKRVEHKDRNNHNFLRNNIYIAGKNDYKQQVSKHSDDTICGIYEVNHNGNVTGYKVQIRNPETNKKKWVTFSAKAFKGLNNAKLEAIQFKMSLVNRFEEIA